MTTRLTASLAALAVLSLFALSARAGESTRDVLDPFDVLTTERVKAHVTYLADPKLEGRCTGEKGCRIAAEYIRDRFRAWGLEPAAGGSYFQRFHVETIASPDPANQLHLTARGRSYSLKIKTHFLPFGFSAEGAARGGVVFAGYGITAPDLGYDDYAGVDVTGKIVLVLRHGPGSKDEKSPFAGRKGIRHTSFSAKAATAAKHGAVAMLLFSDPVNHPGAKDPLEGFSAHGRRAAIPCLHVKKRVAAALLACARKTPRGVQREIDRAMKPASFPIPDLAVALKAIVPRVRKPTRNVAACIEGADPARKHEVVIVGGHYDHIGRGYFGSRAPRERGKIHPGADDNATGTAGVLLLARAFASLPYRPARTVVFVAFAGEEMGLLGSRHYVEHPLFPLKDTVAMVNMDMLGYLRDKRLFCMGTGSSPPFEDMIVTLDKLVPGVKAVPVKGAGGSDQMSFYAKNIPVFFFCTGGHPYYHTPRDTVDRINFEGQAEALKLVFLATARLASMERPAFTRFQRQRPRAARAPARRQRLGIVPDMSFGGRGVKILQVMPASPSSRAGLCKGDVIVSLDQKDVRNMDDLNEILKKARAGQRVSVVVLRDDVRTDMVLTFGS